MQGNNASDCSNSSLDRRSALKAIGATGVAATVGAGSAAATADGESVARNNEPKTNTSDLQGRDERRAVAEAVSSRDFKAVARELQKRGTRPDPSAGDAFVVTHPEDDIEYTTVMVPFVAGDGEQAHVLWTDSDYAETVGTFVEQRTGDSDVAYLTTTIKAAEGTATVTERELTEEQVRTFKQQNSESSDQVTTQGFPNCNVNFSCVGTAAAKAGVLYGVCASCAGGFLPSCAACAGSGILMVETDCSLCK